MRLIDVDKLLKAIHNTPTTYDSDEYPLATQLDGMAFRQLEILDLIEKQPIVQQSIVQQWIPCSEKMPEKPFGCLVTIKYESPFTNEELVQILPETVGWHDGTWNDRDGEPITEDVIAWMPLPEPYKRREDQND